MEVCRPVLLRAVSARTSAAWLIRSDEATATAAGALLRVVLRSVFARPRMLSVPLPARLIEGNGDSNVMDEEIPDKEEDDEEEDEEDEEEEEEEDGSSLLYTPVTIFVLCFFISTNGSDTTVHAGRSGACSTPRTRRPPEKGSIGAVVRDREPRTGEMERERIDGVVRPLLLCEPGDCGCCCSCCCCCCCCC